MTITGSQAFAQAIADGGWQPPELSSQGTPVAATRPRASAKSASPAMPAAVMLASAGRAMAQQATDSDSGSNAWAFGSSTTHNGRGVLLSNPHWPWQAMAKFWQVHITIPGEIDVMGAACPGSPVPLIGFSQTMGWTHTVSTGPRFTIRELRLGATPTSYVVDGVTKPMTARIITIEVKDAAAVRRTCHSTEFGPLIKLVLHAANPGDANTHVLWSSTRAFAFNDINLPNNRHIEQWVAVGKAPTAEAARHAFGTILGAPLVNSIIADAGGNAVYADYSTKPYLTDAKLAACALPGLGQTLTAQGRPTIDGSRASCLPDSDAAAPQPGVLPMSLLPYLRRDDYVVNANNSYWLANPAEPIVGLPSINGPGAADIGLRPRMNLQLVAQRLAGSDGLAGNKVNPGAVKAMLIGSTGAPLAGNRSLAAELLMPSVLTLCNAGSSVTMPDNTVQDIGAACGVLASWDQRYNAESVGTHVFREFFTAANAIGATLWSVPFSPADAVHTPRAPNLANATVNLRLRQALGTATRNLAARAVPLNKSWGELFYTAVRGKNMATGGGSSAEGVANQLNGGPLSATGYNNVTNDSSYVSVLSFGANGLEVDAVPIPGQSVNPLAPTYYDQLEQLWSQRKWQRLPFRQSDIEADPQRQVTRLNM